MNTNNPENVITVDFHVGCFKGWEMAGRLSKVDHAIFRLWPEREAFRG
jgi:hypothetical protein